MKLTWYGHACFKLDSIDGSVVFAPTYEAKCPALNCPHLKQTWS